MEAVREVISVCRVNLRKTYKHGNLVKFLCHSSW